MTEKNLGDYEEGIWTPVIESSPRNPGITYSTQLGRYRKVERKPMRAAQEHIRHLKSLLDPIKPGIGFAIIDRGNKESWQLDFPADTTPEQRTAAQKIIDEYEHSTDPNDQ